MIRSLRLSTLLAALAWAAAGMTAFAQAPLPAVPPGGVPLVAPTSPTDGPAEKAPAVPAPGVKPPAVAAPGVTAPGTPRVTAGDAPIDEAALVKGLADTEQAAALEALTELERGRAYPATAIPTLTRLLTASDPVVVSRVERYLANFGPAAAPALPELGRNLSRDNERVQAYALYAIGRIGEPSEPVLQKIVDLTADDSELVRRLALRTLERLRLPNRRLVPMVAAALAVSDPEHQMRALRSLSAMGRDAVPFLCTALQDPATAWWAASAAAEIGPPAADAVPYLVPLLDSAEAETQLQAMLAIAQIGQPSPAAAAKARATLTSDAPMGLKYAAAYLLTQIARDKESAAALQAFVGSDDMLMRMLARWGVYQIDGTDEDRDAAVEAVLAGLEDSNELVQRTAVQLMVDTYDPTEELDRRVLAIIRSATPEVRGQMLRALVRMGGKSVPHLLPLLIDAEVQDFALIAIQGIGPDAEAAVPKLVAMLPEATGELRAQIQIALGRIGAAASPAVPELIKSLEMTDARTVRTAAFALGSIGPGAAAATDRLAADLTAEDLNVRLAAAWALARIGAEDAATRKALMDVLDQGLADGLAENRFETVAALAAMTPMSEAVKARLEALIKTESDNQIVAAAEKALATGTGALAPGADADPR